MDKETLFKLLTTNMMGDFCIPFAVSWLADGETMEGDGINLADHLEVAVVDFLATRMRLDDAAISAAVTKGGPHGPRTRRPLTPEEYEATIEDIAESFKKDWDNGDIETVEQLFERLDNYLETNQLIVNNDLNRQVVLISPNSGMALFQYGAEGGLSSRYPKNGECRLDFRGLAVSAVIEDVKVEFKRMGVDPENPKEQPSDPQEPR